MLWLSGVLLFPPAPFPWYTLNACHNYMYSKQTAVAADLGPANTKTFLNFSKVAISVVSAARGKYWHKGIWTLQSFQRRQIMSCWIWHPRSLTFHICINLKLKWKPTVEKAYCFRPIQWLDSTAETNEKHRKKWEHDRMRKNQNERTMPLARKWELTKMMIYVAFYFHGQWFITIMKLCQLIDLHKQTTVLQEGWLFI